MTDEKLTGVDVVDMGLAVLDEWLWCLHCERVYKAGEYRIMHDTLLARHGMDGDLQMCPYEDCDGDTVFDVRSWASSFAERFGMEPERGVFYPLYGDFPVRE